MSRTEREREYITRLYDSYSWRRKVRKMRDDQVLAIYHKAIHKEVERLEQEAKESEPMPTHPFEGNVVPEVQEGPVDKPESRPMPCPHCESTKGYLPVGPRRVHCLNCNRLLRNEEVDIPTPDKES
jgi:hypothetical protein